MTQLMPGNKYTSKTVAASLVEVLVALAIVATTMVVATQLTVQALIRIKQDEIHDYVTGIVIQSLELVKSPSALKLTTLTGDKSAIQGSYRIVTGTTGNELVQDTTNIAAISSCSDGSVYLVADTTNSALVQDVCIQVVLRTDNLVNTSITEVEVRAVYQIQAQTTAITLKGYRVAPFL